MPLAVMHETRNTTLVSREAVVDDMMAGRDPLESVSLEEEMKKLSVDPGKFA